MNNVSSVLHAASAVVHIKANNTGVRTGNTITDLIPLLDHECGEATGNGTLVYHDDR